MDILFIPWRIISKFTGQEEQSPAQCVIGIGQEHVRALLIERGENSVRIVGAGKAPHPVRFGSDPPGRIVPVARACQQAVNIALEEARRSSDGYEPPQEAVVGLPVPLAQGQFCRTAARRPDPRSSITEAEVIGLFRRLKRLAQGMVPPGGKLLDIGPFAVSVDGYESTDPRGLKGSRLEVEANVWFLDAESWRAVRALAEHLDFYVVALTAIPRIFPLLTSGGCWLLECSPKGGFLYLLDKGFTLGWNYIPPERFYQQLEGALCELASEASEAPFVFCVAGGGAILAQIEAFLHELRTHRLELFPRPFNVIGLRTNSLAELPGLKGSPSEPEGLYALALAWWAIQKQRGLRPLEALADKVWRF